MKNASALSAMIDNWINGNRKEAKEQARKHSAVTIAEYLMNYRDWRSDNAYSVAEYLKNGGEYQAACDATADEMHTFNP